MTRGDQGGRPAACWLHPHIQVLTSPIHGRGLFATGHLPAGVTVATLAGQLASEAELRQLLAAGSASQRYVDTICVDEHAHLVLPPGQPIHYGNHSCDPNLWHTDAYTLATRRGVHRGEELTVDYATQTVSADFQMHCRCAAPTCRQVVTGNDWQIPQWRERYQGHVVPAVAKRMATQGPRT